MRERDGQTDNERETETEAERQSERERERASETDMFFVDCKWLGAARVED